MYISVHYIYFYCNNNVRDIDKFLVQFFPMHCDSLATQTLLVSDCWHLMLFKHLALSLIQSALSQVIHTLLQASLTL